LTSKDFQILENALEKLSIDKKQLLMEKEELQDLKEEMADYKEDLQQLENVVKKSGTKKLKVFKIFSHLTKILK
jgi:LETM1 and EF-hand domain-containing protein 1